MRGSLFLLLTWVFASSASILELGFDPLPPKFEDESPLIWLNSSSEDNVQKWSDSIDKFLETYKTPGNRVECSNQHPPPEGKVCDVSIRDWGLCVAENRYNYHKRSPCVFLKIKQIKNWVPSTYENSNDLPPNMPDGLRSYITENNYQTLNKVWVSCSGESPVDVENFGPIQYIPRRGFPGYLFPFKDTEGYLSPLIAIYFEKPRVGVKINIVCNVWAKNIPKGEVDSLNFQLLVD